MDYHRKDLPIAMSTFCKVDAETSEMPWYGICCLDIQQLGRPRMAAELYMYISVNFIGTLGFFHVMNDDKEHFALFHFDEEVDLHSEGVFWNSGIRMAHILLKKPAIG